MEIVAPINPMLTDEHVLAVNPKPLPDGVETWRKRINAFQGRALSAQALTGLQVARMAHQSLLHRSVSAGIVDGLVVLWEKPDIFTLLPGMGLTATGEDVSLGIMRQFRLQDLAVVLPQGTGTPDSVKTFSALKGNALAQQSHAAVMLALPVSFTSNEAAPEGPPSAFVPRDPVDDPFAGLMETDGCLFALYPLPPNKPGETRRTFDPASASFRNDLAQAIFADERSLKNGECHPWEAAGLPLALIGFNSDWTVQFVDRASVVRQGGQRAGKFAWPGTGRPSLWDARVEQFGEQLGSLAELPEDITSLRNVFPQLPPVGFLPRRVAENSSGTSIFPETFATSIVPVPADQLNIILREHRTFDPIDLTIAEDIGLALPVPAADYDPDLMHDDIISQDFDDAITAITSLRNDWLAKRAQVSLTRETLIDANRGNLDLRIDPDKSLANDERIAIFDARRATQLKDSRPLSFLASSGGMLLGPSDKIYVWAFFDGNARSMSVSVLAKSNGTQKQELFSAVLNHDEDRRENSEGNRILPEAGKWVRFAVQAGDFFIAEQNPPAVAVSDVKSLEITAFGLAVEGSSARIAELGLSDASGNVNPILTDTLPTPGFAKNPPSKYDEWPWTGGFKVQNEEAFGTSIEKDVRIAPLVEAFNIKLASLEFLGLEAKRLSGLSLTELIDQLTAQINATNDAVDLGFLMARTNTFRVREFMLGSDAASRLATSPALADIIKQDTGGRVSGEQLQIFLEKSKFIAGLGG
jgi:hypothetical protein